MSSVFCKSRAEGNSHIIRIIFIIVPFSKRSAPFDRHLHEVAELAVLPRRLIHGNRRHMPELAKILDFYLLHLLFCKLFFY